MPEDRHRIQNLSRWNPLFPPHLQNCQRMLLLRNQYRALNAVGSGPCGMAIMRGLPRWIAERTLSREVSRAPKGFPGDTVIRKRLAMTRSRPAGSRGSDPPPVEAGLAISRPARGSRATVHVFEDQRDGPRTDRRCETQAPLIGKSARRRHMVGLPGAVVHRRTLAKAPVINSPCHCRRRVHARGSRTQVKLPVPAEGLRVAEKVPVTDMPETENLRICPSRMLRT